MQLFRKQAVLAQHKPIDGEIIVFPKASHISICVFLIMWFLMLLYWAFNTSFPRKETVSGWVEPVGGVIRVMAIQPGIVQSLYVDNGQWVAAGEPLVLTKLKQSSAQGESFRKLIDDQYQNQLHQLQTQLNNTQQQTQLQIGLTKQTLVARQTHLLHLQTQIGLLHKQIHISQKQLNRVTQLQTQGHVPMQVRDRTNSQHLALSAQLQQLLGKEQLTQAEIATLQAQLNNLPQKERNQIAEIHRQMSDINMALIRTSQSQSNLITASTSGFVNNLEVKEGQHVSQSRPLLTITPSKTNTAVELVVPVQSAGFVQLGQELDIRFDSFPHQKYGIYKGTVTAISETMLLPSDVNSAPVPIREPFYKLKATLKKPHITAYGKVHQLKSGMTLSADIQLSQRTVFEWLIDPILSLNGRL